MRTLVTGATGFIGREIIAELLAQKIEHFQTSRRKQIRDQPTKSVHNHFQADIADARSLKPIESLMQIDAVIHCAGLAHQFKDIDRNEFYKTNVLGTENILDLAIKLRAKHFVLISSTAVYGIKKIKTGEHHTAPAVEIDENEICQPETAYAESKLAAEKKAWSVCAENGIALTVLRLAPVCGEGSTGNILRLIKTIDRNRFIWIGSGNNLKSLIYKKDVAQACVSILRQKKTLNEVFNVAGEPILMKKLVDCIAAELDKKIPNTTISPKFFEIFFNINSRLFGIKKIEKLSLIIEKWMSDDVYAVGKIEQAYNFKAKTSSIEAVRKQIAFYRNQDCN